MSHEGSYRKDNNYFHRCAYCGHTIYYASEMVILHLQDGSIEYYHKDEPNCWGRHVYESSLNKIHYYEGKPDEKKH